MSTVDSVAGSLLVFSPLKGRLYLTFLLSLPPLADSTVKYSNFGNYLCFAELENETFQPLSVCLHFAPKGRSELHHALTTSTLKAHCIAVLAQSHMVCIAHIPEQ